ncbi:MAG: depupylase/deamidase Dop [Acidimicrobiales bacterium]
MALPKICGIETEYGIVTRGGLEVNPIAASSMLVNAYVNELAGKVGWDFEDEMPGNDARGFYLDDSMPPEVETHLVNAVLTNGARFYVDHAHPEVSTPEVLDARAAVVFDRAGELIVRRAMDVARRTLGDGSEIVVYKNNSDGKGNSYGCHENYLVAREVPFGRIVAQVTPHFVTRQVFCGAGKVGCELPGVSSRSVPFQLSQRADFFEEEVGLETTLKRPIVNTRDEPHCDATKYRRLHVIVGDANMAEVATLLKVGTTAIVLAMIEDDVLGADLALADPVHAIRLVSHDPSLTRTVALRDGRRLTALELQWELLSRAQVYADRRGLDAVGAAVGREVLERWEAVLDGLESDRASVAPQVDWVAKERLFLGYMERHGIGWSDPRLRAMDLQYHDVRPEKSLAARVGLERLVDDVEATVAMTSPPDDTRAYFRGRCLAKYPQDVVAANWDSLVFDVGADPLRRVPMMEPLRGTRAQVGALLDRCDTAAELLRALAG